MNKQLEFRKILNACSFGTLVLIAIVLLVTYLILLPKNECKITTNKKDAVVYINDKKTDKVKLKAPDNKEEYYFYDFDVFLVLPSGSEYEVVFVVTSNKYEVTPTTNATKSNSEYLLLLSGGEKTKIMSGVCIRADELITNFKIEVEITITKV